MPTEKGYMKVLFYSITAIDKIDSICQWSISCHLQAPCYVKELSRAPHLARVPTPTSGAEMQSRAAGV